MPPFLSSFFEIGKFVDINNEQRVIAISYEMNFILFWFHYENSSVQKLCKTRVTYKVFVHTHYQKYTNGEIYCIYLHHFMCLDCVFSIGIFKKILIFKIQQYANKLKILGIIVLCDNLDIIGTKKNVIFHKV